MLPHIALHLAWSRRAATALTLSAAALALSACADHTTQAAADAVHVRPQFSLAVPEGMSLQCPPRPEVSKRPIEAGTGADLNGNGVVCDEQLGPPGLPEDAPKPPVITTDDLPLPNNTGTP